MKTAILLHGTGGNALDYFWFADTKKYLEAHGYNVWWPQLPHTERPTVEETLDFIVNNWPNFSEDTIIIGHSSACPIILGILNDLKIQIKQVVLVAGFYAPIAGNELTDLMIDKRGYNFDAIKNIAKEIILINSDNDPWGCDDAQARPVAEKLGGRFVLAKGQGHMGSMTFNQYYTEFKVLKDLLAISPSAQ